MADDEKVVAVGRRTVLRGIDLLVRAVDADAQHPHQDAAASGDVIDRGLRQIRKMDAVPLSGNHRDGLHDRLASWGSHVFAAGALTRVCRTPVRVEKPDDWRAPEDGRSRREQSKRPVSLTLAGGGGQEHTPESGKRPSFAAMTERRTYSEGPTIALIGVPADSVRPAPCRAVQA